MYRREIDGFVEAVAMVNENVCAADSAFRAELMRKETALKSIMGKYYAIVGNYSEKQSCILVLCFVSSEKMTAFL